MTAGELRDRTKKNPKNFSNVLKLSGTETDEHGRQIDFVRKTRGDFCEYSKQQPETRVSRYTTGHGRQVGEARAF